jgi:hypothetical protein
MSAIASINSQLDAARREVEQLAGQRDVYLRAAANRHWTETDPATGSGIRRKPNAKQDAARIGRYEREAKVFAAYAEAEKRVAVLEARLVAAVKDAARRRFTREDLLGVTHVRIRSGWTTVVRVNVRTVSVESGYSWVDRVPFDDVLDVRTVTRVSGVVS